MGLLEITKLPTAENAVIHLHPSDNIAIARVALSPGQQLRVEGRAIVVEDPIPAGTEFLQNEDSYSIVARPNDWTWWYTRREFHDDRAVLFATDFSGHQESFYLLKVVNPGSFEISPVHVEPMYQPGIQATSDELHLDVPDPTGVNP